MQIPILKSTSMKIFKKEIHCDCPDCSAPPLAPTHCRLVGPSHSIFDRKKDQKNHKKKQTSKPWLSCVLVVRIVETSRRKNSKVQRNARKGRRVFRSEMQTAGSPKLFGLTRYYANRMPVFETRTRLQIQRTRVVRISERNDEIDLGGREAIARVGMRTDTFLKNKKEKEIFFSYT